jgi:Flp pilus assembly protein TadG
MIIFGIIAASWAFYQTSAITDATREGARAAQIEALVAAGVGTGLLNGTCEVAMPKSVAAAAQEAAPAVTINQARLCTTGPTDTTTLTQTPASSEGNITVVASPTLTAPTSVTVSITYSTKGLAFPLNHLISFNTSSTDPVEEP